MIAMANRLNLSNYNLNDSNCNMWIHGNHMSRIKGGYALVIRLQEGKQKGFFRLEWHLTADRMDFRWNF